MRELTPEEILFVLLLSCVAVIETYVVTTHIETMSFIEAKYTRAVFPNGSTDWLAPQREKGPGSF